MLKFKKISKTTEKIEFAYIYDLNIFVNMNYNELNEVSDICNNNLIFFSIDNINFIGIKNCNSFKNKILYTDLLEYIPAIRKKIESLNINYFIYILRCFDNTLYTGIARDYINRYEKHINGTGAKYTKYHIPKKIEKVWRINGRSKASKVEAYIKKLSKSKKEDLIENPQILKEIFNDIILI